MSVPVIELEHVRKDFTVGGGFLRRPSRTVRAVDDVSFGVERGSILGYIGPNGAGKSTTIKMLTGILVPTSGRVRVAGLEPTRERITLARRIGVMFGQRVQLWWDLPLVESFELLRHVYRIPPERYAAGLRRFREVLDLDSFLRTPVRQLSLGQRIRGELAASMLHEPEILFLDEPTIALDVVAKQRVLEALAEANRERGLTVLLTTHDLADVERLSSRILIIDQGRIAYDGDVERLRERYGRERILVVDLVEPAPPLAVDGGRVVKVDGPRQWIAFDRERTSASRLTAAVAEKAALRDLTIEEPEIEDIVRRIYEGGRPPPTGASSPNA